MEYMDKPGAYLSKVVRKIGLFFCLPLFDCKYGRDLPNGFYVNEPYRRKKSTIGAALITTEPNNDRNEVVFSTQLLYLIARQQNDDDERVKSVLDSIDIHAVESKSRYTLLHYCAEHCNESITKYLLKKGCKVDAQSRSKWTPLMLVLQSKRHIYDRTGVMKTLLEAGADVELVQETTKKSALQMALSDPNFSYEAYWLMMALQKKCCSSEITAQKLIDSGCQLYNAASLQDPRILEIMLKRGFPIDSIDPRSKRTALHEAAARSDPNNVELLLKHGAIVDALDNHGRTPVGCLYNAVTKLSVEKLQVWRVLVGLGSKLTSCTYSGDFQIQSALLYGDCDVIRALLEVQVDFKVKEMSSLRTMLHYIMLNPRPGIDEVLKPSIKKFDLNAVDREGRSSLFYAAKIQRNVRLVKLLLEHGVNADDGIRANSTSFDMPYLSPEAFFKPQDNQCLELLLQHNADSQFVSTIRNGEKITIFEDVMDAEGIKFVVEHLAMLDKLGIPLTEITMKKIKSRPSLQKHFDNCRRLLERKVCGTITIIQLVTADAKRMAKYANNQELVLKLNRVNRQRKRLPLVYPYYYNTVKKRYNEGTIYRMLKEKAVVVICRLFQNCLDSSGIIVEKIVDYLDNQSLQCLYSLYDIDDS